MSDYFLQQPDDLSLFDPLQRSQRFRRDLVGDGYRFFGDATSCSGQRDHAAAAIFRIIVDGNQLANAQAIYHSLDSGSVEVDQTPEMVLGTRPDLEQLGQRGELGLGQVADHA